MKHKVSQNQFLKGALFLSVAGVISKVLSAMYRVPLQNLTGDIGFYTYQQIYPLIGIIMVLGLYGFPQAISKLIAEAEEGDRQRLLKPILIILLSMNVFMACILWLGAPFFAQWMADPSLTPAYRAAGLLFLLLPFLVFLRGQAQGDENMLPTAVSQVTEQTVRVMTIVGGALLIYQGVISLEKVSLIAVYASVLGMVFAMSVFFIFKQNRRDFSVQTRQTDTSWLYIFKTILFLGVFGASTHMVLLWMQLIDVFTMVPSLLKTGLSSLDAKMAKGVFDRGQPLIQFGVVIGSSFALALVPSVTKNTKIRAKSIQEAFTFGLYLASAATLGLMLLMPEINRLLFLDTEGTWSLRILVLSVLLTTITITLGTIIQAVFSVSIVIYLLCLASGSKIVFNLWLIPLWGIEGGALATVMSLALLALSLGIVMRLKFSKLSLIRQIRWGAITLAMMAMAFILFGMKWIFPFESLSRSLLFIDVMVKVILGALSYLSVLIGMRVFSVHQLQVLPFSTYVISIIEKFENRKVKK